MGDWNLHVVEFVLGLLEISLLERNLKRNLGIGIQSCALLKARVLDQVASLVDGVSVRGEGERASSQAGDEESGLHDCDWAISTDLSIKIAKQKEQPAKPWYIYSAHPSWPAGIKPQLLGDHGMYGTDHSARKHLSCSRIAWH